jgi:hypothetical protein
MARIMSVLFCVLPLATAGASAAFAQAGCQPTLTQPCAKPQKPDQSSQRSTSVKSDDEPIDHSKRIQIDKDTDVNFGLGGIGLGRRF